MDKRCIYTLLIWAVFATHAYGLTLSTSELDIPGDGYSIVTRQIQNAIDRIASAEEGGTLIITSGTYVTGSLKLCSNLELVVMPGSTVLGSVNPYDYDGFKYGEEREVFGLLTARDKSNIVITGGGTIDGRGLDLALAIDSLHHIGERIDENYNNRRMRPSLRPKLIDFDHVVNLDIKDVKLSSSSAWGVSLNKCCNVVISQVEFINRAYWNNDGIDISDCRNVKVRDCFINSADDGIVLKSFDPDARNDSILIENCRIKSSASAIKFGTESYGGFCNIVIRGITVEDTYRSAIAIESVDGAHIENVLVDGVEAFNTGNALFLRLGHRNGQRVGSINGVTIKNVSCAVPFLRADSDYDIRGPETGNIYNPLPASITGIPDARIRNVALENIMIEYPGRGTKAMGYIGKYRLKDIPEKVDSYPEYTMFGELPAWGLYCRHIDGLDIKNMKIIKREADYRPPYVLDDVSNQEIDIESE